MFVTDKTISEIADDLQIQFEHGDLHSRSSVHQVARAAIEELADRQLPTRKSLAVVIAKVALATFHETIFQTKKAVA